MYFPTLNSHLSDMVPLWRPSPDVCIGAIGHIDRHTGDFRTLINPLNSLTELHPVFDLVPHCSPGNVRFVQHERTWVGASNFSGQLAVVNVPEGSKGSFMIANRTFERHVDLSMLRVLMTYFVQYAPLILAVHGPQYGLKREDLIMGAFPRFKRQVVV